MLVWGCASCPSSIPSVLARSAQRQKPHGWKQLPRGGGLHKSPKNYLLTAQHWEFWFIVSLWNRTLSADEWIALTVHPDEFWRSLAHGALHFAIRTEMPPKHLWATPELVQSGRVRSRTLLCSGLSCAAECQIYELLLCGLTRGNEIWKIDSSPVQG